MQRISNLVIYLAIFTFSFECMADQHASEAVELWHSQGQFFSYSQYQIYFRDSEAVSGSDKNPLVAEVEKPTIVLLHGFPTSSWDWHQLWSLLKEDYRLVTLDFLGFGFSDKPNIDYSINSQADLVEQLLAHLGLKQAHLLVHDYGTYVAQELLARQQSAEREGKPFFIQSLGMLNGVVYPQGLQLRPIQKALNSPLGWVVSQFVSFKRFSKNFSAVFGENTQPSTLALQDYWYLITLKKGHRISHKLIHYYDESLVNSTRWVDALKQTDVPLMLITGLADPVAGMPMVDKFKELIPKGEVHVLDTIGHYPHVENDKKVAAFYRAFVDKWINPYIQSFL